MKAKNLKKKIPIAGFFLLFIFSYERTISQEKIECSCPMYKGIILQDTSYVTLGGKIIPQAEIKGRGRNIYSATSGFITDIDTINNYRIILVVRYNEYSFKYDNLLNTECTVGQKIERGKFLGRLDVGDHLFVRVSDSTKYIDPEKILPCKLVNITK